MLQKITHILLDAARIGDHMEQAKARNNAFESLYRGTSSERLGAVAPYLFTFSSGSSFGSWYLHDGWGMSWGILLKSSWPMTELQKHLRKFLKVQTEAGQSLYFRFYDPRVLRIFLPTCDVPQILELFGQAIDYFIVEDEDPAFALRFFHQNGVLKSERFPVDEQIALLPMPEPLPGPAEEELPPEVQELRQAALGGSEQMQPQQPMAPSSDKSEEASPAQDQSPLTPKPKTRWNMFD